MTLSATPARGSMQAIEWRVAGDSDPGSESDSDSGYEMRSSRTNTDPGYVRTMQSAFEGRVAIVTGGASGIGAALGRELARNRADVVLADRQRELAEQVAEQIRGNGGRAVARELDVRDLRANVALVDETIARSGHVDYFFANAGIGVGGEMENYVASDWDDVFDVNLRGVAYGIQAVYPHMIRRRSGHIIPTASMAGLVAAAGEGSYTAAKHAVVGLAKSLRVEAATHGVRVSVLCPGAIRTPILTGGKFGRFNFTGLTEERMLEVWQRLRPMDADTFAKQSLRGVARNEPIIVVPRWWKALWYLERISPSASIALWRALMNRLRAELAASGARPIDRS
jgi:NAD(P)-dependent dehydrogenase (short-subunit alcohol dehydrogenase family)